MRAPSSFLLFPYRWRGFLKSNTIGLLPPAHSSLGGEVTSSGESGRENVAWFLFCLFFSWSKPTGWRHMLCPASLGLEVSRGGICPAEEPVHGQWGLQTGLVIPYILGFRMRRPVCPKIKPHWAALMDSPVILCSPSALFFFSFPCWLRVLVYP